MYVNSFALNVYNVTINNSKKKKKIKHVIIKVSVSVIKVSYGCLKKWFLIPS